MNSRTLFIAAAVTFAMSVSVFAQDVTVSLNGSYVNFPNQRPVISEGRTLIPLRGLFDNMGYNIGWDGNTKTVTLTKGGDTITINIGESCYYLNGKANAIDVPAQIINGSTMLPLRAIADATGAQVSWDGRTKIVSITYSGLSEGGTVTLSSQAEADYLEAYNDITGDYAASLQGFISAVNGTDLSDAAAVKAALPVFESTYKESMNAENRLKALKCPAKFTDLHNAALDYIGSIGDMCKVVADFADGDIKADEFGARLASASETVQLKETEFVKAFDATADN